MNVVLWVVASLLSLAFAVAGLTKLVQPKAKLASNMGWVEDFPDGGVKAIGALEVLAALGLILPAAFDIVPVVVPLAAVGLIAMMLGAAITHGRRDEQQMMVVNIVLLTLAAVVAWGRFGPYSFGG
jgi:uncharacterized membrane protein YphA (DoxX/SURF4 family)